MVPFEVLDSPILSEADRLALALDIGNGEISATEILDEIAHTLTGDADANLTSESDDGAQLPLALARFLADVVNA